MQGLYWNDTIQHIRAGPIHEPHEIALFKAKIMLDNSWMNFGCALDTYVREVWPERDDAEVQAIVEKVYANQLMIAAQLVDLWARKVASLEQSQ